MFAQTYHEFGVLFGENVVGNRGNAQGLIVSHSAA
jgi:hypothetical protein